MFLKFCFIAIAINVIICNDTMTEQKCLYNIPERISYTPMWKAWLIEREIWTRGKRAQRHASANASTVTNIFT